MKRHILISLFLATVFNVAAREYENIDRQWLFFLEQSADGSTADAAELSAADYDDASWRTLNLPHDWSVEGDFHAGNPCGASGGALPGGIGWYRKHLTVDEPAEKMYICFDGVYMNSTVYINGTELGTRPYGYSTFWYDITPYVKAGQDNVIAVRVDNSRQPNCRWYSGSGIYRHVYLLSTAGTHVAQWGTFVTATPSANMRKATFDINVELENGDGAKVTNTLLDAQGKQVGKATGTKAKITISNPQLWSVDNPYIYTVKTEVTVGGKVVDTYETRTGVRSFSFDAEKGFSLNGQSMKINGVCQHHDLGCLGTALNEDALHRQLRMLKEMGCNSIRCSHNPPSPELLEMCDTMGFIVMDESFDMWHRKKTKYDYSEYFDEWYERDLSDLVRRDRNHPSIMIWSIGNEVLEQWSSDGEDELTPEQANLVLNMGHDASTLANDDTEMSINSLLTKRLADIIKSLDPTRPVTAGCNEPDPNNHLFKSGAIDIIGYNYHNANVADVPKNFPGKPFIFSESVSALMTRGYYVMPSDSSIIAPKEWWLPYAEPSYMCSSYDNTCAPWANHHEETWDIVKHNDFVGGQYIWTGWDYIGEPTPYSFPAHSSYFGIIDIAGFPKDIYYMYQSEWTDRTVLHLFPHWNWLPGQTIDMWCYYSNADEVELFVNGQSQGVRTKDDHTYHVCWRVEYEPGSVKVVARKDGRQVGEQTINTAGQPDHLVLTADRSTMAADGKSLAFVTVNVVDKDGNLCPWADDQLYFDVEGEAVIAGVDNGAQASTERFKDNKRKAFFGKALVVLQSTDTAGSVSLTARAIGLPDAVIELRTKN